MKLVTCKNAYYVKLGRNGKWEESSIKKGLIRIGWENQTLSDINSGNWTKIKQELEAEATHKGTATRDYHALRMLCESTPDDLWITFHANHLWWCKVGESRIFEDKASKYRKVEAWFSEDVSGRPLLTTQIPGRLAKLQGFRGTICKVKEARELVQLLNSQQSAEYAAVTHSKEALCRHVETALRRLHWKDFETLVDLLFRASGWRRVSVVGETMKFSDIELEEPITGEMYQVQVKSTATPRDFMKYADHFAGGKYRKLFFVVHSPDAKLSAMTESAEGTAQLVLPRRLAEMVVSLGLLDWLMDKIR